MRGGGAAEEEVLFKAKSVNDVNAKRDRVYCRFRSGRRAQIGVMNSQMESFMDWEDAGVGSNCRLLQSLNDGVAPPAVSTLAVPFPHSEQSSVVRGLGIPEANQGSNCVAYEAHFPPRPWGRRVCRQIHTRPAFSLSLRYTPRSLSERHTCNKKIKHLEVSQSEERHTCNKKSNLKTCQHQQSAKQELR